MGKELIVFAVITAVVIAIAYLSLAADRDAPAPEKKKGENGAGGGGTGTGNGIGTGTGTGTLTGTATGTVAETVAVTGAGAKEPADPPPPPPPPKTLAEMTDEELSKELSRVIALHNGDESAPAVVRVKAYVESRESDKKGFPTASDLQGASGSSQTGLEKATVHTLSFLEKAYREVLRFSQDTSASRPSNTLKDRLLEAVEKTLSDEENRLRAVRNVLTKETSSRKDANDQVNRYKEQWRPAFATFRTYLEADRARRAPNAMISFLIHMNVRSELSNYVQNPYAFVRLDVAGNTPKLFEWLIAERYKMDNAGSKALRPIVDADSAAMRRNLKNAGDKAMDEEAERLRKIHDEHNVSDVSGRSAKKLVYEDFLRQRAAAEANYEKAVDAEPRGVMFDFLWTTQEVTKMSTDDIAKLVTNPAAWVAASPGNAKRMRTFVFTNEYFR